MIQVIHVKKRYNESKMIVDDISFEVKGGMIYGLLGPNGAGKTTLMQMISTLLKPTSGSIKVCGMDTTKDALEIHKKIGFLTTEVKLDPLSTPNKLYDFFAKLYDIPDNEVEQRKKKSFDRFGIGPFADKKIRELSTGMKQKVSIAISLIHEPPVIIFDEPTNGLDVLTSKQVTDYLIDLRNEGRAIILSTHIFSLTEQLCDVIGILVGGHIVEEGSSEELCNETNSATFEEAFFKIYSKYSSEA